MGKSWKILAFVLVAALMLIPAGCSKEEPVEKLSEIRLVGTIGPLAIPLAYMAENNVLDSVAEKTTMTIWANPAQLQAVMGGHDGDFVSLPVNSAATFYNKGIQLKLLDCSIWNILFLISTDPDITSIEDLEGKRVVVPFKGASPDVIFQYNLEKHGLDPEKDIEIYYAPDPVQATQLFLSGQEDYVLLSEPSATTVMKKAAASGMEVYRNLDMNDVWKSSTGGDSETAMAGTIALGSMAENSAVIDVFLEEYEKAVKWMLENPEEAGKIGARALAEQGFTADVLAESMSNIDWKFTSADKAYDDIVDFLTALMDASPNFTGGKMPDDAFYYGK
ncbi:MAG: ABC transporter substrate-binding protein [Dehalococcoidales bacterium]|nr:ABC transporter substrate-binding protein [Dehalococcoidales bacterium]